MILEGLVTTTNADGSAHLAPMGPRMATDGRTFLLRPFPSSTTYTNLCRHPEGVLHVTDNVLLLARAAVGHAEMPPYRSAERVRGHVLLDACRYYEFRVTAIDDSEARMKLHCTIEHSATLRDFFGFNRAKHAVLEAAILATRFHLIPPQEIDNEFQKLRIIVDKTSGPQENEAMAFLEDQWRNFRSRGRS